MPTPQPHPPAGGVDAGGQEPGTLSSGSTPTDEHLGMTALLAGVLLEAARRRQEELPGLVESLQEDMLLLVGGTTRPAYGWFQADAWRHGERQVHEVFLNADRHGGHAAAASPAEDVLTTLLHEACHVWAHANGIKDTSRGGRYHNHRFAKIALQIGLQIEHDPVIGFRTPRLSTSGQADYADLLITLKDGLTLTRESPFTKRPASNQNAQAGGDPDVTTLPVTSSKYVFAACHCLAGRGRNVTIRVATGSWRPSVIQCGACGAAFEESLTMPG